MKKEYKRFTVEVDTSFDDIFVSVTHSEMTVDERDNSYEYVNTFEEACAVIAEKIRECF